METIPDGRRCCTDTTSVNITDALQFTLICADAGGGCTGGARRARNSGTGTYDAARRSVLLPRDVDTVDSLADHPRSRTHRDPHTVPWRPHRGASQLSRRLPERPPVRHAKVQLRPLVLCGSAASSWMHSWTAFEDFCSLYAIFLTLNDDFCICFFVLR